MKVSEEQIFSLQVSTSKPDVYVRLSILDNEEEVASAVGKGHVVIPAFIFQKESNMPGDVTPITGVEMRRSSSRTCKNNFFSTDIAIITNGSFSSFSLVVMVESWGGLGEFFIILHMLK